MFIAALVTRAKTWKQPTCLSTDEWTKMWYIYTMECYWAIKRRTHAIFGNMDRTRDSHAK